MHCSRATRQSGQQANNRVTLPLHGFLSNSWFRDQNWAPTVMSHEHKILTKMRMIAKCRQSMPPPHPHRPPLVWALAQSWKWSPTVDLCRTCAKPSNQSGFIRESGRRCPSEPESDRSLQRSRSQETRTQLRGQARATEKSG